MLLSRDYDVCSHWRRVENPFKLPEFLADHLFDRRRYFNVPTGKLDFHCSSPFIDCLFRIGEMERIISARESECNRVWLMPRLSSGVRASLECAFDRDTSRPCGGSSSHPLAPGAWLLRRRRSGGGGGSRGCVTF